MYRLKVTYRVYVGNAARLEKEDLRDSFVQFGDKEEDAEKAIREGNGMEIRGDRVTVELARSTVISCYRVNHSGRSQFASLSFLLERPLQPLEKL